MLLSLFQWLEASAVGSTIRESTWMFPAIEGFHLLAFAAIGGAILVVDLRLLGLVLARHSVAEIAAEAQPWLRRSVGAMIASGSLLLTSEAIKCYYSDPFWIKMECLSSAIVFTWIVRNRVIAGVDANRVSPAWGRLTACASLALWSGVAWGGRWIGFSG